MHNAHGFALIFEALKHPAAPVMALFCCVNATALKAMHKAGRRGGDSIARGYCKHTSFG
jgi:hypothetical protein